MGETRVTIQEAARVLGVSEGAIRKRVKRNTLRHEKGTDGRVYIYLDAGVDEGVDEVSHPDRDVLISEMESRIAFLERELDTRSEEIRRRDAIIMNMTEAMKALSPPAQEETSEAREAPVSPGPGDTHTDRGAGPQEGTGRRSWWREWFGFD